jgi:prepilin-type N-terminal cleavage/methylation domain-containing protein
MKNFLPLKLELPHSIRCGSNGFTLVEVLLVLVIILIAAGVAMPRFKGTFASAQMTDTVRTATRMARYARSLSILKQSVCTLEFEDSRMILFCGTNSATPETVRRMPDDIKLSSFENLTSDAPRAAAARRIRFYPAGMNDGFRVTFQAGEVRRSTVLCSPVTGKITVLEEGR